MLDVSLALGGLALLSGVKVFDTTKKDPPFLTGPLEVRSGGMDGDRTRDLRRDRPAL